MQPINWQQAERQFISERKLAFISPFEEERLAQEQRIDKMLADKIEQERKQRRMSLRRKRKPKSAYEQAPVVSYTAHSLQLIPHKQLMRGSDGCYYWMDKKTFQMTPTTLTAAIDEMEQYDS